MTTKDLCVTVESTEWCGVRVDIKVTVPEDWDDDTVETELTLGHGTDIEEVIAEHLSFEDIEEGMNWTITDISTWEADWGDSSADTLCVLGE